MLATVHTGMINYFYPGVFLGANLFHLGDGAGFCCKMLQVKELFQHNIFPCPYLSASIPYLKPRCGQCGISHSTQTNRSGPDKGLIRQTNARLEHVKNFADCFRSQVPYGFRCLAWLSTLKHGMFFPNCVQILREGQEQIDNSIRTLLCGVPPDPWALKEKIQRETWFPLHFPLNHIT